MKLQGKLAFGICAVMLGLVPAVALGDGPNYHPQGPPEGKAPKGKAYGYWCRGESKKHVKGQKGTAFSRCVKAMAKAAQNDNLPPGQACKGLSKKHKRGEKGTAFSRCVTDVAKIRKQQPAVRYESPPLEFGPNGWGGWSCPIGTTLINGGYEPSTATVAFSGPAKPGEPMYPVYPHYTFNEAEGEVGWVVQNDNDAETITVFVICK